MIKAFCLKKVLLPIIIVTRYYYLLLLLLPLTSHVRPSHYPQLLTVLVHETVISHEPSLLLAAHNRMNSTPDGKHWLSDHTWFTPPLAGGGGGGGGGGREGRWPGWHIFDKLLTFSMAPKASEVDTSILARDRAVAMIPSASAFTCSGVQRSRAPDYNHTPNLVTQNTEQLLLHTAVLNMQCLILCIESQKLRVAGRVGGEG